MWRENGRHRRAGVSRRRLLTGVGGATALLATGATAASAQTTPTERWQYAPGGVSNIRGHDGTYYVTAGETIQAVDATSGEVRWTVSAGGAVWEDAFTIDAETGTAVVASRGGTAVGVALADGSERWRRSIGGPGIGVAVADGRGYLLSETTVLAVDAGSGERVWRHDIPGDLIGEGPGDRRGIGVARSGSGAVPVYHTDVYVVGIDDAGNDRWRVEPSTPAFLSYLFSHNSNNLVTQGKYVYYQADTDPIHGLIDASAGSLVWERTDDYTALDELRGGPARFRDTVVNSGADATVLSVPGGREQWSTGVTTYDGIRGTEEALYVCGNAGGTAVLRSFGSGGSVNWTLEFGAYDTVN